MKRHWFIEPRLVAVAIPLLGACVATKQSAESVRKIDDLLSKVEVVQVAAQASKETSRAALDQLAALCAPDFAGDAKQAYALLLDRLERSEKQASAFRGSVEPMRQTAESIFAKWTSDLAAFGNLTLRQRSLARLEDTRARYQAVFSSAQSALISYDLFNTDLRDHALFLGHDLNAAAVAELSAEVLELQNTISVLDARLSQCANAARIYVEEAALYGRSEAPQNAEAAPGSPAEPSANGAAASKPRASTPKRHGTTSAPPMTKPCAEHGSATPPAANPPVP